MLADALTFHVFEIEGVDPIREQQAAANGAGKVIDEVIDVKVTPNRGHDALSHRAIAKELSAVLNIPIKSDPFSDAPELMPTTDAVSVSIADAELCPRYIAGYIKGVKVGQSPEWLQERLEAIGQRSINNVVDATNFVMFNIGQPLHAFDAGQLKEDGGFAIEVRRAKEGEVLLALDDKEYKLSPTNLVISDKNSGSGIGIAGVKGGKPAGITETTKDIIIESANFNGVSVRRTAKALNLATDASQRFQQVISPELAAYGIRAVADMIVELAGGKIVGFTDAYEKPVEPWKVSFTAQHTSRLLGIDVPAREIANTLMRLGFIFAEVNGTFEVTIPVERLDLTISEDLIEEVGRLIGYERIPAKELPAMGPPVSPVGDFAKAETIREQMLEKGYSDVYTSVFADAGDTAVLNKVDSIKPFLRSNLVDGLSEALKKNAAHRDLLGLREVKLFEIGTVWNNGREEMHVASVGEKEKAEEKPLPSVEPSAIDVLPVSTAERYYAFSRYPSITRDIALWVPAGTEKGEVRHTLVNAAGLLLVRIDFFDEFKKGDRQSYAYRLVFQSNEKTLTDEEANEVMNGVYEAVKKRDWTVR